MSQQTPWRSYEEVAQYLLNQISEHFGLGRVEGKQIVSGASGTEWEIDAKGVLKSDEGFVIIECRRHTRRRLPQGHVGELAFRIQDTGAAGGIIVSPLPLQAGAKIVAESKGIHKVELSPASTTTDFILKFLERTLQGKLITTSIGSRASVDRKVIRASTPNQTS
jgi:hypothetical protein